MAKRESPTYVNMGIEKEMLIRLHRPLKSEIKHLYKQIYRDLPAPGLGSFIAFLTSLGMDVVRDKYLPASRPPGDKEPKA